jgi:hypothetical protein
VRTLAFASLTIAATLAPAIARAADEGAISGVVTDTTTKAPLRGALVIIECRCLQDRIETSTDGSGLYAARNLPPGPYVVTVLKGKAQLSKSFELPHAAKLRANFSLSPDDTQTRTVYVPRAIESSKPKTGVKIAVDEWAPVPADPSRTFDKLAEVAPSASTSAGRLTIGGGTPTDIKYSLGGASMNSPRGGMLTSGILTDFLSTVEVLEAGYDAEFGDASTGQVQARRQSGSNKFRGTARFTFTPRIAKPRIITGTDNAVRAIDVPDFQMQGAISMSGPLVKDKLFWAGGIAFTGGRGSLIQSFHRRIDKDGSGGYEGCPYENGAFDCVEGGDDIATEKFAEQKFKTGVVAPQFFGGIDWVITPKHILEFTVFGSPAFQRRSYRRAPSGNYDPAAFGGSLDTDPLGGGSLVANGIVNGLFGWDRANGTLVSGNYRGRVANDTLEIDATLAYREDVGVTGWKLDDPEGKSKPVMQQTDAQGTSLFRLLDEEKRLGYVAGVEDQCNDPDLPGQTCPVRQWLSGGIGQYGTNRQRRAEGLLSLTHFFNAAGSHQLKYGARIEHLEDTVVERFSGNNAEDFYGNCAARGLQGGGEWCYDEQSDTYEIDTSSRVDNHRLIRVDTDNPDSRLSIGYGRIREEQGELRAIATPLGAGARVDAYRAKVTTQNYAVYLQDRWALRSNVFLSAGVRWEMQDMRDVLGRRAIFVWDNAAPRVGLTYDWTDEGRSRLFASYGWFYQPLPLQLNSRVFGGLVQVGRTYRNSDCVGRTTTIDGDERSRIDDRLPTEFCTDTNSFTTGLTQGAVVPRLKGQYNQQFQIGYEQEIIEDLTVGVRWLHNDLGRAVEDVSTDGGNNFIVANPGVSVAGADITAQQARCDSLQSQLEGVEMDDERRPQIARDLQRCEFLVDAFGRVGSDFTRPRRAYDGFTFHVTKRLARNWMVSANYTYSRLVGNTDGFVDPTTGVVNLGASAQYDLPELVRNSFGPLSNDTPHRVRIDGYRIFDLDDAGQLTIGTTFRYQSGTPVSLRGSNSRYGAGSVYVVPRGAGGRVEGSYQWNLTVGYAYPVADTLELEVAVRWFNVTNAKAALRVDEIYSFDTTRAVAGGDLGDVKHAKIQSSNRPGEFFSREVVAPQGNYGVRTSFQNPTAAQLDIVLRF